MKHDELVVKWEQRAADLGALSAKVDAASLCEQFVADLRSLANIDADDWVCVAQAAKVSGYSEQHIRRLIKAGQLEAEGSGKSRRVRLRHLPKKPTPVASTNAALHLVGATAEQAVRESVGTS